MKDVQAVQAEHSDRIQRLEKRNEDDARLKALWGTSSPFTGALEGTPQQVPVQTPAGEDFTDFDQAQQSNLLGSLQLDHDEEPRRGASRANSVRFDETAIHGHWMQGSRSSGDLLPLRTSGIFGGHPLTERSSSHKSDGRQSSAGQSAHSVHSALSARTNSLRLDAGYPSRHDTSTSYEPAGPPPGIFVLGTVPSIIRCWLETNFSHDTLLYAVVCTGSYKSFVDLHLVKRLQLRDQVYEDNDGELKIKLPVFLPEATVQQASSRSSSPAPSLPTLTVVFSVTELPSSSRASLIQIYLGSDILRTHNADVLFSQSCMSLLGDDHRRLSVPFVRPEDETVFKSIYTSSTAQSAARTATKIDTSGHPPIKKSGLFVKTRSNDGDLLDEDAPRSMANQDDYCQHGANTPSPSLAAESAGTSSLKTTKNSTVTEINTNTVEHSHLDEDKAVSDRKDLEVYLYDTDHNGWETSEKETSNGDSLPSASTSTPKESAGGIWGSWRREQGAKGDTPTSSPIDTGSYQRPSRGRGTKVLRVKSSTATRSASASHPSAGSEPLPSNSKQAEAKINQHHDGHQAGNRRTSAEDKATPSSKQPRSAVTTPRSANPVGGASAFAWLNGGHQKTP
ncbi:MAG: hypothetical protein M1825_002071 [Sarcosagium campestre]|nr:MAG: hypothetical protein M1825_002071 [Sarcosagium campestre]